jgi:hypothetical protein
MRGNRARTRTRLAVAIDERDEHSVPRGAISHWRRSVGALVFYVLLAGIILARGVIANPSSTAVGDPGSDKTIFMWAFVWWPHALRQGNDPFFTHAVWAPAGIDLSWVTAVPGPSLLAFPLTWAVGPVVAYNVLAVVAPALAAWTAFILAEWLTDRFWPALIAGYLFGFSAYEIAQTQGHLNLTLVFLVPLCGLLVGRRFAGELSRQRFVVLLALALAFQLLISSEVFSTTILVGVLLGLLALWRLPSQSRSRLAATARESALALAACGFLSLPYLIHAFVLTGPSYAPERSPFSQAADLLNFVIPGHATWLRPPGSSSIASNFTANPVEAGAYLGLPLLLIVGLAAFGRRSRTMSLLLLTFAAVALCSLGSRVRLDGQALTPGPWELPAKLPITRAILPVRLSMFVALLAALLCALWLTESNRRAPVRWALALAAAVVIFPTPSRAFWTTDVPNPAFFASKENQRALRSSDIALVFPFGKAGWSMLWQAENHMRYRMVGGHLGNRPPDEARWNDLLRALISGRHLPANADHAFPHFLRAHRVTTVVVAPGTKPTLRRLVQTLPVPATSYADVLVYRVGS